MEKLKREKHNHKLTDLLKVLIFSVVMLAPIFSVVSKVMYVSLNKNAYQSYSASEEFTYYEKQVASTNDIENTREFHEDNWYYFSFTGYYDGNSTIHFEVLNDTNINADVILLPHRYSYYDNNDFTDITIFNFDYINLVLRDTRPSNNIISIFYGDDVDGLFEYDVYYVIGPTRPTYSFLIKFNQPLTNAREDTIDFLSGVPSEYLHYITTYEEKTINQSTLDNTFEYAVNGLVNNNLYNWAQDTFAYTSINAMCTGLSVQNGVLPLLLSYWVIITAIYIVFDIIIFTFTKLTHLLQD